MSGINVDLAVESKRDQVIVITKFLIATVSTILGWKCLSTRLSPFETDFGASALFIAAVLAFVAALRARLVWTQSVWPEIICHFAELAGLLASVALLLILNRPFGWFAFQVWGFRFLWITFLWLRNLHLNYTAHIQPIADDSLELLHQPDTQQPEELSFLPV